MQHGGNSPLRPPLSPLRRPAVHRRLRLKRPRPSGPRVVAVPRLLRRALGDLAPLPHTLRLNMALERVEQLREGIAETAAHGMLAAL